MKLRTGKAVKGHGIYRSVSIGRFSRRDTYNQHIGIGLTFMAERHGRIGCAVVSCDRFISNGYRHRRASCFLASSSVAGRKL
jgi:hypothetical protein